MFRRERLLVRLAASVQPTGLLERGFERCGLRTIAAEQGGLGTYYLARRV
jgi:hypothetical protein